jgi:hypothetical protein
MCAGLASDQDPRGTIRPTFREAKPGRPGHVTVPEAQVYSSGGALTSSLVLREALVAQHRCFILATHALDTHAFPAGTPSEDRRMSRVTVGFSKIRSCWPRRAISKSLNGLWPC